MSIGEFSFVEKPEIEETFTWGDEKFRINPDLSDSATLDVFEIANQLEVDQDNPEVQAKALSMAKTFMRDVVHPEDFDRFWKLGRKHRQGTEEYMALGMKVVGGLSENPPSERPASSDGPQPIAVKSVDALSSRVIEREEAKGRSDIAEIVQMAAEARAGAPA